MRGRKNPNPPKSPEEKSRTFNFRLNPSDPIAVKRREHHAIQVVDAYLAKGEELREIMTKVLVEHYDREALVLGIPKESTSETHELSELKVLVQWIATQLENGVLVHQPQNGTTEKRKSKKQDMEASKSIISRFISLGVSEDE